MPILVVGTGRCGSSRVARILHTRLGVSMGERFREPDETQPDGYYEDLDFRDANEYFLRNCYYNPYPEDHFVRFLISKLTLLYRERQEPWGLKDPRLCYLLKYYLPVCPDYIRYPQTTLIAVLRPRHYVIDSMRRCYGWRMDEAARIHDERVALMSQYAFDFTIHIEDYSEDSQLESTLGHVIRDLSTDPVPGHGDHNV